jgi:acetyl esterase
MSARTTPGTRLGPLLLGSAIVVVLLGGCASAHTEVLAAADGTAAKIVEPELVLESDLPYGATPDSPLLDACLPPETADDSPRAAVVLIHGGSWARGDKADEGYGPICQRLAAAGFATFSINYRLSPQYVFPSAIDDVEQAVRWLREPEQVKRFGIDPARIGAFGGSAGGNLAALLGTRGSGDWTTGSRVAAVVDLSGPADLTGTDSTPAFAPVQLAYLGCAAAANCPAAVEASPLTHVDPSDPPFFIAHSTHEIIPLAQSAALVGALRQAGVETEFVTVDGDRHSIAMLDAELEQRIVDFLTLALAPPAGGTA